MDGDSTLFDRATIFLVLCLQCGMSLRELNIKSPTLRGWRGECAVLREIFFPRRLSLLPVNYQEDRSRLAEHGTLQVLEMKPCLIELLQQLLLCYVRPLNFYC